MESPLPNRSLGQTLLAVARQPHFMILQKIHIHTICFMFRPREICGSHFQNIIGAIPNTNNNLRLPAPIFNTPPKSVIGTIPNTNNYLRYPAPIFKIYTQKYYWCYSQDQ